MTVLHDCQQLVASGQQFKNFDYFLIPIGTCTIKTSCSLLPAVKDLQIVQIVVWCYHLFPKSGAQKHISLWSGLPIGQNLTMDICCLKQHPGQDCVHEPPASSLKHFRCKSGCLLFRQLWAVIITSLTSRIQEVLIGLHCKHCNKNHQEGGFKPRDHAKKARS